MSFIKAIEKVPTHYKCRNSTYPRNSSVIRFNVPDDKVPWDVPWIQYSPVLYTSEAIKNKIWADPPIEDQCFRPKWNELDGNVNRKSHIQLYKIKDGLPLNPLGRTGIVGRGCLGRWGPNHAADPILTRWKRNSDKKLAYNSISNKPILQFVAIQRKDCKEWAIPGGMVDPGETVSATLKREFLEEALSSYLDNNSEHREILIKELFKNGTEIYKGYVDDPRNTDNAWMETVATNFHHENGNIVDQINLTSGDDAINVKWVDLNSTIKLYANHIDFLARVAELRGSHW